MATNNTAALRKRAQINKANRTMFLWIAICSAVAGSAIVVSYFLVQQLFYNERVLIEKNSTISTLEKNIAVIPELQTSIRVLDTNQALATSKANEDDQTVQVILDALPSEANSLALGASLQSRLLSNVPGASIQTLQVDTVEESEDGEISFQFSVSGDEAALKAILQNLERSIRLIDVISLRIESQSSGQLMTIRARAFYEPAKTFELTDKVVEQ